MSKINIKVEKHKTPKWIKNMDDWLTGSLQTDNNVRLLPDRIWENGKIIAERKNINSNKYVKNQTTI